MEITRIIYNDAKNYPKNVLAVCSVIFDDVFKITGLCLCEKFDDGSKFIVMPSEVGTVKQIEKLNPETSFNLPEFRLQSNKDRCEEFYHPVSSDFYKSLLEAVVEGYLSYRNLGKCSYRPGGSRGNGKTEKRGNLLQRKVEG